MTRFTDSFSSFIPILLAALMSGVALFYAVNATHDLQWPGEMDFFRDMGSTQSIVDGQGSADALFYRETRWYNPGLAAIFAQLVTLTGLPIHVMYAQAGPYLNLLGPVGLFVLAWTLFGRWAGVLALGGYLFLGNHSVTTWHQATYSAWAWSWNFAQGLFFLSAVAMFKTLRGANLLWSLVSGILLGLTLLVHTAPTFILAVFFTLSCFYYAWHSVDKANAFRYLLCLLIAGITAFLIALPYLGPIFSAYGFKIKNVVPTEYVSMGASEVLHQMAGTRSVVFVFASLSLWFVPNLLLLKRSRIVELRIFFVSIVFLTLLAFSIQVLRSNGIRLPQMFPAFHFHMYFKVLEILLFAAGMLMLSRILLNLFTRMNPLYRQSDLTVNLLAVGLLGLLILTNFPSYVNRTDFQAFREAAIDYTAGQAEVELYQWVLRQTKPEDVFLVDGDARLMSVSAAGRKLVAHEGMYTNPYINYQQRLEDHERMKLLAAQENWSELHTLAERYSLDFLIVDMRTEPCCSNQSGTAPLKAVFRNQRYVVYRYRAGS